MKKQRLLSTGLAASLVLFAAGCSMPNASNPTLALRSASVTGDSAELDVELSNPSDMDVEVDSIDWQLLYGPLPVAEGLWEGPFVLKKGESMDLSWVVDFDSPPVDPHAESVELSGSLLLKAPEDDNMALNAGSFVSKARVEKSRTR